MGIDELQKTIDASAKSMPQNCFCWQLKVANIRNFLLDNPRPACIESPDFRLGGLGPFKLRYFPNGNMHADLEYAGVYLKGPVGVDIHASFKLTINDESVV